jgi:branched-chain amino acid transport system permease protein
MALLGGPATVAGPVLGAAFLGLLSEILLVKFRYLYMLSLGLVLIVVVLALPRGLAGLVRARRPGCGSPSPTL